MFGFNRNYSFMEAEKENLSPEIDGNISPFNVEAKRTEILERLFSKSTETTNFTNEMSNFTNNYQNRDEIIKPSDRMEIVDHPYNRNRHFKPNNFRESFSSNYSQNSDSNLSTNISKRKLRCFSNIQA